MDTLASKSLRLKITFKINYENIFTFKNNVSILWDLMYLQ